MIFLPWVCWYLLQQLQQYAPIEKLLPNQDEGVALQALGHFPMDQDFGKVAG